MLLFILLIREKGGGVFFVIVGRILEFSKFKWLDSDLFDIFYIKVK